MICSLSCVLVLELLSSVAAWYPVALCAEVEIPPACVGLEGFWDKTPRFGCVLSVVVAPRVRGLW